MFMGNVPSDAAERETKVKGKNIISNYSGDDLFGYIRYVKKKSRNTL